MNWGYIIVGSLIFLGISLFFYFATRKNYYRKPVEPIQQYEDVRNKVTVRKKEEPEVEIEYSGGFIGNIIGGFVVLLIGFSLMKPMSETINVAINQTNMLYNIASSTTTWGSQVLIIIPGFFVLGFLAVGIALGYSAFRNAGFV